MRLTVIQSAVVASGIFLAGSLASSPVLAQSGSENGQRAESAMQQERSLAEESRNKGQQKGQAERMREMKQAQDERARERAQEQGMREQGEASADAASQNRKADPANKGSEQGQARKQEKSRAWWNFWGD